MFGYSLTRPTQNQDFYYGIFDACRFTEILLLPFYSYPWWLLLNTIIVSAQEEKVNENFITQAKISTSLSKAGIPSPDPGFTKLPWNLEKSRAWPIGQVCLSMFVSFYVVLILLSDLIN